MQSEVVSLEQQRLLECPICMDFLVSPMQTQCGHTFCEICLTEALLKSNICAMCKAPQDNFTFTSLSLLENIVRQQLNTSIIIDKITPALTTSRYLKAQAPSSSENTEALERYEDRSRKYSLWNKCRRPQKFAVGMKVDVRDLSNIWCAATIIKITNSSDPDCIDFSPSYDKFISIHYDGWKSVYDEMLPVKSNRIASIGFFTKRSDIPQYRLHENIDDDSEQLPREDVMQAVLVLADAEGIANLEGDVGLVEEEEQQHQLTEIEKQRIAAVFHIDIDQVLHGSSSRGGDQPTNGSTQL